MKLPKTPFFETFAFTDIFPELIESDRWDTYDYIGTVSWKAPLKFAESFKFGPFIMVDILKQTPNGTDVIALVGQKDPINILESAEEAHPRFGEAWRGLLQAYNRFTPEQIETTGMEPFYCNYWLAKPRYVKDFISFMQTAHIHMTNLSTIQDALWTNAKYLNNTKVSQDVFGLDYYTNHPFVLERLSPFFFGVQKLNIFIYKKFRVVWSAPADAPLMAKTARSRDGSVQRLREKHPAFIRNKSKSTRVRGNNLAGQRVPSTSQIASQGHIFPRSPAKQKVNYPERYQQYKTMVTNRLAEQAGGHADAT